MRLLFFFILNLFGLYSKAASIQDRLLFKKIRYSTPHTETTPIFTTYVLSTIFQVRWGWYWYCWNIVAIVGDIPYNNLRCLTWNFWILLLLPNIFTPLDRASQSLSIDKYLYIFQFNLNAVKFPSAPLHKSSGGAHHSLKYCTLFLKILIEIA